MSSFYHYMVSSKVTDNYYSYIKEKNSLNNKKRKYLLIPQNYHFILLGRMLMSYDNLFKKLVINTKQRTY
jgi:hypothetical protein